MSEPLISWSENNMSLSEATSASINYAAAQKEAFLNEVNSGNSTLGNNLAILGLDSLDALEYTGPELVAVGNAAGNAALAFLRQKMKFIYDGISNKRPITIRALIGEVSPYVLNTEEAFSKLGEKTKDLMEYLLGVDSNNGILAGLGDQLLDFIVSDPGVKGTVESLSAIKVYADTLNTISDAVESAQRIMKIVEPYIPIVEIASQLFSAIRTQNPNDLEGAGLGAQEEVVKKSQRLLTLLLGSFRRYIYNLEIMMPELFLGAINSVSIRDAVQGLEGANDWVRSIFDEQFYDETLYSTNWNNAINKALNETLGTVDKYSSLDFDSEFLKTKIMSSVTQNLLKPAIASARKTAGIRIRTEDSWQRTSQTSRKMSFYYIIDDPNSPSGSGFDFDSYLDNSNGFSPINSTLSLRVVSKQILDRD